MGADSETDSDRADPFAEIRANRNRAEPETKENEMADTDAIAAAEVAGVGAAQGTGEHDHTTHDRQFDSRDSRVSDFDKDTGSDERIEVAGVDTRDLMQTYNLDGIARARRWEDAEHAMRLRHADAAFNQTHRHYEDMHTMRYGVAGEMVEAIANKVWATCPWGHPKD